MKAVWGWWEQWKLNMQVIQKKKRIQKQQVLKFFIHKLDASLQITVHGQNFFKCRMKNKTKMSQLCQTWQSVCWCQKMKWKWDNESFQHTIQLEKRPSPFTTAWLSNFYHLFISSLTSFSIFEGRDHASPWRVFCTRRNRIFWKKTKQKTLIFLCHQFL